MQSQTSNGTVKLLVSDMQKAQRIIEAMRDESKLLKRQAQGDDVDIDALVEALKRALVAFYGAEADTRRLSPDFARIIHDRHHARLLRLLQDSRGLVVFGGENDPATRYIGPTLLTEVDPAAPIMQEEIFGPLLPILKVPDMEAAVFSGDRRNAEGLIARTTAGGGCINDTLLHFAHTGLPTGGVNTSGFGKAHGRHGFEAFSNARGLLRQRTRFSAIQLMYPPYPGFVRRMIDLTLKHF